MTFIIVSGALHYEYRGNYYSYAPYVTEMNIWLKYADKVIIVAPAKNVNEPPLITIAFDHPEISLFAIPDFNIKDLRSTFKTILLLPLITSIILRGMKRADHIHLRCPGNAGLMGSLIQILFPCKIKTAKYAGNWDWTSNQPWSYRLQQRILRNTFLTRNMTALVYGNWPAQTKNIKPLFTASYSEKDRTAVSKSPLNQGIKLAFIGTLSENKSPLKCLEVLRELSMKKINATLTFCGDGPQKDLLEQKISEYDLHDKANLLGNVDAETVKKVLQNAHFLIFISRSEGWPKAVSEAMWWGCIPITTPVSCVPWMLDNGNRGELVTGGVNQITSLIEAYISDQEHFNSKSNSAMQWSREYTLERFEKKIKNLI